MYLVLSMKNIPVRLDVEETFLYCLNVSCYFEFIHTIFRKMKKLNTSRKVG